MSALNYLQELGISDRVLNREDLPEYQKSVSELMKEFADQENYRYKDMEQQVVELLSVTGCKNIIEVIELFKDGKVAVAFAEWKGNNVMSYETNYRFYFWDGGKYIISETLSDLYKYFINNVYNK